MREAVIVDSVRTPLAKSFRGSFNRTHPADLMAHCLREVLQRHPELDPREVEDVIVGCGQPHGPQGVNVARIAAVLAGLPVTVAATTVNRFCSSGLQSRRAEAIDCDSGDRHRQPGQQSGDAGDVRSLDACRIAAAGDHVFDLRMVDLRRFAQRVFDAMRELIIGARQV